MRIICCNANLRETSVKMDFIECWPCFKTTHYFAGDFIVFREEW